jgi:hypothetical protein
LSGDRPCKYFDTLDVDTIMVAQSCVPGLMRKRGAPRHLERAHALLGK